LQEANWGAKQYGVYAQDEWTVTPGLKITGGLRVDIPQYSDRPNYNRRLDDTLFTVYDIHYRTDEPPKTTPVVSPRVGFNWALDDERTAQVRGGIGIFSGRFPYVWVSNQYSNTGVDFYTRGRIAGTDTVRNFISDPHNQPKLSAATLPSAEVDLTDRDFKAPSVLRWTLAFDYKLPWDIVGTIEGIFSTTRNDVYTQNLNLKGLQTNADSTGGVPRTNGPLTPNGRIVGENREVWGVFDGPASSQTPQWIDAGGFSPGIFLVRNTNQGFNSNVTVHFERNVPSGINGGLGYTWGIAKDINSNNSTTASSQWRFNPTPGNPNEPQLSYSQWDRRHHVLANIAYRFDWGTDGLSTTVGLYYNGQSGRPFSYMVVGDVNGDGRADNDLAYIPANVNDIILVPSATGAPLAKTHAYYLALFQFIDRDVYLGSHKGRISERSGPREPWSNTIDLRIAQEIPVVTGHMVEITFDILNLMNFFDSNAGWIRNTGANQTVNLLQFRGLVTTPGPDYGKARYQWLGVTDPFQPDNILSRWQMQFGIRYTL
jgi:hypothetical protein